MNRIVLFDVDHTITHRSTGRRFAQYGRTAGVFRLRDLLTLPVFYARYRLGRMDGESLDREFAPLRGKTAEEIDAVAEGCFQQFVRHDIYPQARELVRGHIDGGDTVVLASTSLDVLVTRVARHIGVQSVIASRLEYKDGLSTGRTEGPPCFGREKRRRALSYIEAAGLTPEDAVFYSDSIHDLPLLAIIGTPIPVNPDPKLRRLADRHGWRVLTFKPPR
jgi:HAD superfamily hydrolase (TIGR01490 family)